MKQYKTGGTKELHQLSHLISKRKLSQSINGNYIYQQRQRYCETVICDIILGLSSASMRLHVKEVLLWNHLPKPRYDPVYQTVWVKSLKHTNIHRHICAHFRVHKHWQDLLRAVMTVITSGLTLTSPSWLSDWLCWWRDVNRGTSLRLWLGLNYTPSVCFH